MFIRLEINWNYLILHIIVKNDELYPLNAYLSSWLLSLFATMCERYYQIKCFSV